MWIQFATKTIFNHMCTSRRHSHGETTKHLINQSRRKKKKNSNYHLHRNVTHCSLHMQYQMLWCCYLLREYAKWIHLPNETFNTHCFSSIPFLWFEVVRWFCDIVLLFISVVHHHVGAYGKFSYLFYNGNDSLFYSYNQKHKRSKRRIKNGKTKTKRTSQTANG